MAIQSATGTGAGGLSPADMTLSMTIGISRVSGACASATAVSQPLIPGITMSSRITPGRSDVARSIASRPEAAAITSYPRCARIAPTTSRTPGSSSHSKTRDRMPGVAGSAAAGESPTTAATGSVKENVLPRPTTLSAQMRPPCCSTIRRQIASPSPVPPFSRESEASTC